MKLLSIVGARPQFVKAAAVVGSIERWNSRHSKNRIRHILVHTGQHYEHQMSGVFFEDLRLPTPDHHLGVGSAPHGAQTAAMLAKIEAALVEERPDVVLVYGDTNSTAAGALAAAKLHIKVAHLESGLRSFNREMPEEINRVVADHLSDILLCPTETAVKNLRKEGITRNIHQTGDVMLDVVLTYRPQAQSRRQVLSRLDIKPKEYALATIHRAENTDRTERLSGLLEALMGLPATVVLPLHPRVRNLLRSQPKLKPLHKRLAKAPNLRIVEPLSYLDMLALEINARMILTDSGGVQKEAFFAGVPCLTLRSETEWLETKEGGWNRVVGTKPRNIRTEFDKVWSGRLGMNGRCPNWKSFGNGRAGDQTVAALARIGSSGGN